MVHIKDQIICGGKPMEEEKTDVEEEEKEEEEGVHSDEEEEGEETKEKTTFRTTEDEKTSRWMLYANLTSLGAFIAMIGMEKWEKGAERDMVVFQAVQQFFITLPLMIPGLNYIYFFVWIVLTIIALVKTNSGECWEMPFVSEYVYKALGQEPA